MLPVPEGVAVMASAEPVLESVPVAPPVNETVPAELAVNTQVALAWPPPGSVTLAGVGPDLKVAAPVLPVAIAGREAGTTTAAPEPELVNVIVTVKSNPCARFDGIDSAPVTAAGACTVTMALAVFDVTARAGLFASNPEADAEAGNGPATAKEQFA